MVSNMNQSDSPNCEQNQNCRLPNVILITLDTTRADRLGCYGYKRPTSPNIDILAKDSIVYDWAIAPSSWTLPSHASLFTGKFTSSHGARYDPNGPLQLTNAIQGPQAWQKYRANPLSQNELTLAEILSQNGLTSTAVIGGPWLKRIFQLDKGFEYYDDAQITTLRGRSARSVTVTAANWLEKIQGEKFFLFINYFDPHFPYMPPEGFATAFLPDNTDLSKETFTPQETNALYDAEILYMDFYLGLLLQKIKADNLYNNTLIIVTADHGELLGEHNEYGHGNYLYQQELHIPLLVKYPAGEISPHRTSRPVQLNDIFAMVLDRLGIAIPDGIQADVPPKIEHPIIAETYPLDSMSPKGLWQAIINSDFKFIWNSKGCHQLYNLITDPHEKRNAIRSRPKKAADMQSQLKQYLAQLPKPVPVHTSHQVDEQTQKALKSLGYVGSSSDD